MLASIQAALDSVLQALPWSAPVLCILIFLVSSRRHAVVRTAYLGYFICALIVALFQLHLVVDGMDIFMAFGYFLTRIVVAGVVAFAMTVAAGSNSTLWIFGAATIALGFFQLLNFKGIYLPMNAIARAYVLLVLSFSLYRWSDWWPMRR